MQRSFKCERLSAACVVVDTGGVVLGVVLGVGAGAGVVLVVGGGVVLGAGGVLVYLRKRFAALNMCNLLSKY